MIFEISYLTNFKILLAGILIYILIFLTLNKIKIFGDNKNTYSLIALISAIIVSFTGVLTYLVTYAITWFSIILFLFTIIFLLLGFLGVKINDIESIFKSYSKPLLIVFIIIFSIIFIKSFFALNNVYDISNPQNDSYVINTSPNTGIDDIGGSEPYFWEKLDFDSDMLASALFLIIIGGFVMLIG